MDLQLLDGLAEVTQPALDLPVGLGVVLLFGKLDEDGEFLALLPEAFPRLQDSDDGGTGLGDLSGPVGVVPELGV